MKNSSMNQVISLTILLLCNTTYTMEFKRTAPSLKLLSALALAHCHEQIAHEKYCDQLHAKNRFPNDLDTYLEFVFIYKHNIQKILKGRHAGSFILHWAARYNCSEIIDDMIDQGLGINLQYRGQTPLMIATKYDNPLVIESLLKHRADIDLINAQTQRSALQTAAHHGNLTCFEILLKHGAAIPQIESLNSQKKYNFDPPEENYYMPLFEQLIQKYRDSHD